MATHRAETRAYYEAEAEQRLRGELRGPRLAWRTEFIELMQREGRTSVVDFGAGPGHDLEGFVAAGVRAVGLDLAVGNARLASAEGLVVIPADVTAAPMRPGSFDAAWSMSTIMHLGDELAVAAVAAMAACTAPGSPLMVGVWGGDDVLRFDETIRGHRRPFHRRSVATNHALFSQVARIESVAEFDMGSNGYQLFQLRS